MWGNRAGRSSHCIFLHPPARIPSHPCHGNLKMPKGLVTPRNTKLHHSAPAWWLQPRRTGTVGVGAEPPTWRCGGEGEQVSQTPAPCIVCPELTSFCNANQAARGHDQHPGLLRDVTVGDPDLLNYLWGLDDHAAQRYSAKTPVDLSAPRVTTTKFPLLFL